MSLPKQLVQVSLKEADSIEMQLLQSLQLKELQGKPGDDTPPLLWGDKVLFTDVGESKFTQVPHLAQVRSQVKQKGWTAGRMQAQCFYVLQVHLL